MMSTSSTTRNPPLVTYDSIPRKINYGYQITVNVQGVQLTTVMKHMGMEKNPETPKEPPPKELFELEKTLEYDLSTMLSKALEG
jgi:hypothetical protein